jgi:hypothetical protein
MSSHSDSNDHHQEKPTGFLNTVFDETMGGFGIVWASAMLICISLLLILG